jgi:hypothetical protein
MFTNHDAGRDSTNRVSMKPRGGCLPRPLYVGGVLADGGAVCPLVVMDRSVAWAPRPLDIAVPNSRKGFGPAFCKDGIHDV